MNERYSNRTVERAVFVTIMLICVLGIFITLKVCKARDTKIIGLREENTNLQLKVIKMEEEINDMGWQDRVDSVDWELDKETQGILSMTADNFRSEEYLILPHEDINVIKDYLDTLVDEVPFLGSYLLEEVPEEYWEWPIPEGNSLYNMTFFIDIHYMESINDNPERYEEILKLEKKHNLYGLS